MNLLNDKLMELIFKKQMVHDASVHVDSQRSFADAWTFVGRSRRCRIRVHFTPGPFSGLQWRCRRRSHAKSQSVNIHTIPPLYTFVEGSKIARKSYIIPRESLFVVWVVITRRWKTITSEEEEWSGKSYYVFFWTTKNNTQKSLWLFLVDDNLW
jgi:hypothetical protein